MFITVDGAVAFGFCHTVLNAVSWHSTAVARRHRDWSKQIVERNGWTMRHIRVENYNTEGKE